MTKREEREIFFKMVFMAAFQEPAVSKDTATNYLQTEGLVEYEEMFLQRMEDIMSHLEEIDNLLNELAEGWKTSRMAKVDLAILRVAVFEMKYEGLSKSIAINEAVEIAKAYGEERSYAFINGILAKI